MISLSNKNCLANLLDMVSYFSYNIDETISEDKTIPNSLYKLNISPHLFNNIGNMVISFL